MTPKEQQLRNIQMFEDYCSDKNKTYKQISEEYNISPSRVRAIILRQIRKACYLLRNTVVDTQHYRGLLVTIEEQQDEINELRKKLGEENRKEYDGERIFLKDLDLSVRTANCFVNMNLTYLDEVADLTENELYRTPNFGKVSLAETKNVLNRYGYSLKERAA